MSAVYVPPTRDVHKIFNCAPGFRRESRTTDPAGCLPFCIHSPDVPKLLRFTGSYWSDLR